MIVLELTLVAWRIVYHFTTLASLWLGAANLLLRLCHYQKAGRNGGGSSDNWAIGAKAEAAAATGVMTRAARI